MGVPAVAGEFYSKFAVVVWAGNTDTFKAVREQLVSIAKDEPDESTELEGIVDFHWGFDSRAEAERLKGAWLVARC